MPVKKVDINGKEGYQWGNNGKIYSTKEKAENQARAAYANGYTGDMINVVRHHPIDTDFIYHDDNSVRKESDFGRLEITRFNISKESVNNYKGKELAQCEELGLDPERIYQLYRPGEELEKAADSFNQVPITIEHPDQLDTPLTPQERLGATGNDTRFERPYLVASAKIWDADAIAGIANNTRREVSIFSTFDVEMQPGIFDGQPYDGIIRNIRGNSVALTIAGRAGQDVAVGDSTIKGKLMEGIKNILKSRSEFAGASDSVIDEVHDEIMKLLKENKAEHEKIENDIKSSCGDSDEDETENKELDRSTGDEECEKEEKTPTGDSAIQSIIKKEAEKIKAHFKAREEAQDLVRPYYGKVIGDSAEEIYRNVLQHEGINFKNIHPSAYKAIVGMAFTYKNQLKQTKAAVGDSTKIPTVSFDDFEI